MSMPINNDINDLLLSNASLDKVKSRAASLNNKKEIQAAKQFEALFVQKLMDSMKNTVKMDGIFDDPVGEQINSMFYSCLADDISQKGGLGMWKEIYKMMGDDNDISGLVDETI